MTCASYQVTPFTLLTLITFADCTEQLCDVKCTRLYTAKSLDMRPCVRVWHPMLLSPADSLTRGVNEASLHALWKEAHSQLKHKINILVIDSVTNFHRPCISLLTIEWLHVTSWILSYSWSPWRTYFRMAKSTCGKQHDLKVFLALYPSKEWW